MTFDLNKFFRVIIITEGKFNMNLKLHSEGFPILYLQGTSITNNLLNTWCLCSGWGWLNWCWWITSEDIQSDCCSSSRGGLWVNSDILGCHVPVEEVPYGGIPIFVGTEDFGNSRPWGVGVRNEGLSVNAGVDCVSLDKLPVDGVSLGYQTRDQGQLAKVNLYPWWCVIWPEIRYKNRLIQRLS